MQHNQENKLPLNDIPMNNTHIHKQENEANIKPERITQDESKQWLDCIDRCTPAIVTIRILLVRSFEMDAASYSVATGFIVDAARGIILTNRHVVTPGPVVADAVFLNKEEVDLIPIYRDPVHDFGFFKFRPEDVKFLTLHEIPLQPEGAKVGVEIRVVGNDAGEKLSILPGILAKIDREAPHYGSGTYNDFNTFYYGAASSTSGGSSGSPVLNIDGCAIALNAGGARSAASSYYLPLDRVVRALKYIQAGEKVPRGTIQTILRHRAFDEVRRLGLTTESEAIVRKSLPNETGMLVVDLLVPEGPGQKMQLQIGDILLKCAGKYVTSFLDIESYLDDHIGETIELVCQRGGKTITFNIPIQDLHSITPSRFFEVGGGVVQSLSYQIARNTTLPVGGVYLADAGHMFFKGHVRVGSIITALNGKPTPTLDEFINVISQIPSGERTTLHYFRPRDRHHFETAFILIDRLWSPMKLYTRNDDDGLWHAEVIPDRSSSEGALFKPPTYAPVPLRCPGASPAGVKVLNSMVIVSFDIPMLIDGVLSSRFVGVGCVLDAERGLVLVDQNTVPTALGDALITVAGSIEIPAIVVFIHPTQNYSIVKYDPAKLGTAAKLESMTFAEEASHVGDAVEFIGLCSNWSVVTLNTVITKLDRLVLPDYAYPRFIARNVEVFSFDRSVDSLGGVFLNSSGHVCSLWFSFAYVESNYALKEVDRGLPAQALLPDIKKYFTSASPIKEIPTSIDILPIQLTTYSLSKARTALGLTDEWIHQAVLIHEDKRQVLGIDRCTAGTDAAKKLKVGDLILRINNQIVIRDNDFHAATNDISEHKIMVCRDQKEVELNILPTKVSSTSTDRLIIWCGMVLQKPHYAVPSLGYIPEEGSGVYFSSWWLGSPAHKYNILVKTWIASVNDVTIHTLEDFLQVVKNCKHGDSVRIKTISLDTKPVVTTLKTDYHYWPTIELRMENWEWKYINHEM